MSLTYTDDLDILFSTKMNDSLLNEALGAPAALECIPEAAPRMSVQDALRIALEDMKALSPDELRADLDSHAGGDFAVAMGEVQQFLYGEDSPLNP